MWMKRNEIMCNGQFSFYETLKKGTTHRILYIHKFSPPQLQKSTQNTSVCYFKIEQHTRLLSHPYVCNFVLLFNFTERKVMFLRLFLSVFPLFHLKLLSYTFICTQNYNREGNSHRFPRWANQIFPFRRCLWFGFLISISLKVPILVIVTQQFTKTL